MQLLAFVATTVLAYMTVLGVAAAGSVVIMVALQVLGMRTSGLVRRIIPPNVVPRGAAAGNAALVAAFALTQAFAVVLAVDVGAMVLGAEAPFPGWPSPELTLLTWVTGLLALIASTLASFLEGVRSSAPAGRADLQDDGPRYGPESSPA